jgi:protein-tyrosine phosphatase
LVITFFVKQNAYLHCFSGVSRSGAIVCAYLMKRYNLSYDNALAMAKKGRAVCQPNSNFEQQLQQFQVRLGL